MIIRKPDFLERAKIDRETLEVWIEEEWLIPAQKTTDMAFSELDLARARLIRDLTSDLGVNGQGVGLILNLVDQVHGLRKALAEVLRSVHERSTPSDAGPAKDAGQHRK